MKASIVTLAEVCEINPSTAFDFEPHELCSFLPMEDVDERDARIARLSLRPFQEVSKGYTPFAENDVIVAKITPCMENGKCTIARRLRKGVGFGSTEFHVLRPTQRVLPEWLLYFWRSPRTRQLAASNMTGSAGQKRVPAGFLERLEIQVPSVSEQQKAVERLNRADRIRRTRHFGLELLDSILPAAFVQRFGNPVTNPMKWPKKHLGEVCTIRRGASPRPIDKFMGGTVPWIKIGDGTKGDRLYISATADHVSKEGAAKSVFLKRGSLVLANSGVSCGFARILRLDGCIHDGWLAFQDFEKVFDPIFLLQALNQITLHLRRLAPEGTQPNLNTGIMSEFPMVVPPMAAQEDFAELVQRVERLRSQERESLRQAKHLFETLLREEFEWVGSLR